MTTEIIKSLDLQIYKTVEMPDGGRIVSMYPYATPDFPNGKKWPSVDLANHNIFRLDKDNNIVWQVQRVENSTRASWEELHRMAKEEDPNCEGYYDSFRHMSEQFFEIKTPSKRSPEGQVLSPAERVYFEDYQLGRLICLSTHWWAYDLDPETGIATCTGEQVK